VVVVGVVVDALVVVVAQRDRVAQVGVAAGGPGFAVVELGLPPDPRTPSQWSSGHGEVFA
jgi:hypothetical protein